MQATNRRKFYLAAAVGLATFMVYLPALRNEFVDWDDNFYIFENPHICSLDAAFFRWAFLGFHVSNWHPLTWISHAVDYAVWGLNPLGHHLTNIVLHAVNTVLVVLLTGKLLEIVRQRFAPREPAWLLSPRTVPLAAAATGLLFGIHPVHVESVAWVAERKDLLCGLFFLMGMIAYMKYAASRHGGSGRQSKGEGKSEARENHLFLNKKYYLLTLGFFVLALMSKPMAVSLPVVLLIMDWYVFNRIRSFKTLRAAIAEKFVLFALSLAVSIIAIMAQKAGSSLLLIDVPLPVRIGVAAKSLFAYLGKIVLPFNLIPFYPYPKDASLFSAEYLPALALVIGITSACIIRAKKNGLWLSAWGYYVVTLLPVLGIVQVGEQSMADRYTYLPSVVLFQLIGVAAARISGSSTPSKKRLLTLQAFSIAIILSLSYLTIKQTAVWRNSVRLWTYVIEKEPQKVPIAYNNRGIVYEKRGQLGRALADFNAAIALDPGYAAAYYNRGSFFEKMGRHDNALADFNRSLSLNPDNADSYYNRAVVFENTGRLAMAAADYDKAISLNPSDPDAYYRRGLIRQKTGQIYGAIADYTETIRINPRHFWSYENRGIARTAAGHYDQALEDFTLAILLFPNHPEAYYNRGSFYLRTGKKQFAAADFEKACNLGSEKACMTLSRSAQ